MRLIVGLGNKDDKYRNTRHNVGFLLIDDYLATIFPEGLWKLDKKFNGLLCKVGADILLKPQTNMNISGVSVSKVASYYAISSQDITVVHDDVDLGFGDIRLGFESGSAGHKGVQSIIDQLGTNSFHRVRFGIGRPENSSMSIEDWVLMNFASQELEDIRSVDLSLYLG